MLISQVFSLLLFLIYLSFTDGTQLIIVNNCKESIWPGILGTAGHQTPLDGGLHLPSGEQLLLDVPQNWSGRIWGRQGCCFDPNTGKGSCLTGDCAGMLQCKGLGGVPPATLVEMTLGTPMSALHFYDVSLVDGFNVPISMVPVGSGVGCGVAACEADLNVCCPLALVVKKQGRVVGCKSACLAAKRDSYCCTGEFASAKACKPSVFGHLFKAICRRAYSYALMILQGSRPAWLLGMSSHFVPLTWDDFSKRKPHVLFSLIVDVMHHVVGCSFSLIIFPLLNDICRLGFKMSRTEPV